MAASYRDDSFSHKDLLSLAAHSHYYKSFLHLYMAPLSQSLHLPSTIY